jgi:hypothetical protein
MQQPSLYPKPPRPPADLLDPARQRLGGFAEEKQSVIIMQEAAHPLPPELGDTSRIDKSST